MYYLLLFLDRQHTNINGFNTRVHGYGTSAECRQFFKSASDQTVTCADETITLPVARKNNTCTEAGESHALSTPISNNNDNKVIQILNLSQKLLN